MFFATTDAVRLVCSRNEIMNSAGAAWSSRLSEQLYIKFICAKKN